MTVVSATPEGGAARRVAVAFVFFALLLAAYYLLRPVRDALVSGLGSGTIKYLSSLVLLVSALVAIVYAWLVSTVPRRWLVPGLYGAFAVKLLGFAVLFRLWPDSRLLAQAFYLWLAVFNLWMVSTFWSLMADLWSESDARRDFGRIAAGGSLGGLVGPWLAHHFVETLGPAGLLQVAAGLLALAALLALTLLRSVDRDGHLRSREALAGSTWAGLLDIARSPVLRNIAFLVAGGSILGMFLYIEVAKAAAVLYPDIAGRTAFFAERDFAVNALSLGVQFVVASWLLRAGVMPVLVGVSALTLAAFAVLAGSATVTVLLGVNILLRTVEFGLGKPARDAAYAAMDESAKYRAKNLIDTVFYRACDSSAGWLHALVIGLGGGLATLGTLGACAAAGLIAAARGIRSRSNGARTAG